MSILHLPTDQYERIHALAELENWLEDAEPGTFEVIDLANPDDDYPHLNG